MDSASTRAHSAPPHEHHHQHHLNPTAHIVQPVDRASQLSQLKAKSHQSIIKHVSPPSPSALHPKARGLTPRDKEEDIRRSPPRKRKILGIEDRSHDHSKRMKSMTSTPVITIPPRPVEPASAEPNLSNIPQLWPHRKTAKPSSATPLGPPPDYSAHVQSILGKIWTKRTWSRKRSVWKQYSAFHQHMHGAFPLKVHENSAMEFVAQIEQRLGPVSAKEYGKDLIALRERLKRDLPSLVKALSAADASAENQAPTMFPTSFVKILQLLPLAEKRTAWLQWMSASRWADVANPTSPPEIVPIDRQECGVLFGKTKGTGRFPYREDMQLILRCEPRLPEFFTPPLSAPLSTWTTTRMDEWLKGLPPPSVEERDGTGTVSFTTHSVKRGALRLLTLRAAKKEGFPPHLISLLAKHKGATSTIAPVTMRYLRGREARLAMARILRTQEATVLLNPL